MQFSLVTVFCLIVFGVVCHLITKFVLKPYRKRRYYKKQGSSIQMTERFYPFLGDYKGIINDYQDKGKFIAHYVRDLTLQKDATPLYLFQIPNMVILYFRDVEWLSELNKLIPKYVDREPIDNSGFGKIGSTGGLGQVRSTEAWKKRREVLMKTIGINHASKFIPLFIKHLDDNFGVIGNQQEISFSQVANTSVFSFILSLLFGKNVLDQMGLCNYEAKDGSIKQMKLYDCMMTMSDDMKSESLALYNVIFPELVDYNLGRENRRNERNNKEIGRVLNEFIAQSTEKNSVYAQVIDELKDTPQEQILSDCISLLIGGHETTFMSFTSAVYCLKKYPEVMTKLMKEIQTVVLEGGKISPNDFLQNFNHEKLDEMEYLTMFIKEVLRLHPSASRSLGYKTLRPLKIKDVMIPKGEILAFDVIGSLVSPKQWKDPMNFIPERFDPTSEYFKTPSGKNRHPLSYIPFTFGSRTCPGRSLAMLELKVAIVYFMLKFEYQIEEDFLQNPDVTFSIYSPFELHMKINNVKC